MSKAKYRIVKDRWTGLYNLEEGVKSYLEGQDTYWYRQFHKDFSSPEEAHSFLILQIQVFVPLEFDENGIRINV